jgi:hypothetical protein
VEPGTRVRVEFEVPMTLRPGYYSVSPGLAYNQREMKYLDYIDHALVFRVVDRDPERHVFGILHPDVKTRVTTAL